MKIEKLAENKIKVMLTTADLVDMDMDIDSLETNSSDSNDLNNFLFFLMERIKEETGFNPYGGQILMEAVPMGDEGISIMVSKVHNEVKHITKEEFKHLKYIKPKNVEKKYDVPKETGIETFYIKTFDDVCMLLKELNDEILLSSALYKIDDEFCFLLYKKKLLKSATGILSEFSYRRSYHNLQGIYIKEHGKLIASRRRLLGMAEGIKSL